MAIVLDGMVESAATIQSAISTTGQITGNFTPKKDRRHWSRSSAPARCRPR